MDRVLFLNSSGAIVTDYYPYPNPWYAAVITENPLPVAPYVETVALPTVNVVSSAIYGEHPENLATPTHSGGAALTFFCDSVAGGNDSRGVGTFDDPWRSLRTASSFFERNACVLRRAAAYVQLKVRGVVDYVSGNWKPFDYWDRFIIAGWGARCDLGGSGRFYARYLLNVRGNGAFDGIVTYSGGAIADRGGERHVAVDCELDSTAILSCGYNCSGAFLEADVIHGGSFGGANANYVYSVKVSASFSGYASSRMALYVGSGAVLASVTASGGHGEYVDVTGIRCHGGAYLGGCVVDVHAEAHTPASATSRAVAQASAKTVSVVYGTLVFVSGGRYAAVAKATASASAAVTASAYAGGFTGAAQVTGAQTSLSASAGARVVGTEPDARAEEIETLAGGGSSCWERRTFRYSSGALIDSGSDSGCRGY